MELLSFNGNGTVYFFAGNNPASLAYVPSPPGLDWTSVAVISDSGPEASSTATFTPGPPIRDGISGPTEIIDNGLVSLAPEPESLRLLAAGALAAVLRRISKLL